MNRPLGIFETAQLELARAYCLNIVAVLQVDRTPTPANMRKALDRLQARHPLLRARINSAGGTPIFATDVPSPIPLAIQPRATDSIWEEYAAAELGYQFDTEQEPLMRALLLQPDETSGETEIVLTWLHAIADGVSAELLVQELLTYLGSDALDDAAIASGHQLCPPAENLFPARLRGLHGKLSLLGFMIRQMKDEMVYQIRSRGQREAPPQAGAANKVLTANLDQASVSVLEKCCRTRKVTLNSATCTALLLAIKKHLYPGPARLLRNFVFADLRAFQEPQLAMDNLGANFSMLRFTSEVDDAADFWPQAKRINDQMAAALKTDDRFFNFLLSKSLIGMVLRRRSMRMGQTGLSFLGAHGLKTDYGALRLTGLRAFVSGNPQGPEYSALASVFEGELWLDVTYLDAELSEQRARVIAADVLAILVDATSAASA